MSLFSKTKEKNFGKHLLKKAIYVRNGQGIGKSEEEESTIYPQPTRIPESLSVTAKKTPT